MSLEMYTIIGVVTLIVLIGILLVGRRLLKRVCSAYYVKKWREIQRLCVNKDDWTHAIVHADMLLDEVLKKRRIGGKTMGERLVNAQSRFSAHDAVWNAHKLANTIRQDGLDKVPESKVKETLVTIRQALRDLGAL